MYLIRCILTTFVVIHFVYGNELSWTGIEINEDSSYKLQPNETISYELFMNTTDRRVIYNQNIQPHYVKVHLVLDYSAFKQLGKHMEIAKEWSNKLINMVDALWQHANLRVYLALFDVLTEKQTQDILLDADLDTAKDVLVKFRSYNHKMRTDNDYVDLISATMFVTASGWADNTIKGRASNSPCTVDGVAIIEFNMNPQKIAYLFSHEMAHIFNMKHPNEYDDIERCVCNPGEDSQGCIVKSGYDFEAKKKPQFTICDIETLNSQVLTCIENPPKLFVSSSCGNRVIEPGEECDCGSSEKECHDKCCNFATCKLKEGVQCSRGPCCQDCKFKSKEEVCRNQNSECDLPEMCTGDSEWCPDDMYKWNGLRCMKNTGYCWNGLCQIRDKQCVAVWGKGSMSAAPSMYSLNKRGPDVPDGIKSIISLNCGLDENDNYISCSEADKLCGALLCKVGRHRNPILEPFGYTILTGGTFVLYNKHPDHKSVGKVGVGTECGTEEQPGMCIREKNIHRCDFNLTKYFPTTCETPKGGICGGSNRGYCNFYGRCICKNNYDPNTNCMEPLPTDVSLLDQPLKCYSCSQESYCSRMYKNQARTMVCPSLDMVCYSTRLRYKNNIVVSHIRGCLTTEKCVPGCVMENHVEKCTRCCDSDNCNNYG